VKKNKSIGQLKSELANTQRFFDAVTRYWREGFYPMVEVIALQSKLKEKMTELADEILEVEDEVNPPQL